jgi:hypothetical protein
MNIISILSNFLCNPSISLKDNFLKICTTVKSAIPFCERVGIRLFNANYSEIVSLKCIDASGLESLGDHITSGVSDNYRPYYILT